MHAAAATQTAGRDPRLRQLAWLAIVVGGLYLLWRGAWRAIGYDQDLNVGYAAAQAWLSGANPYDADTLRGILSAAGYGQSAYESSLVWRLNVYFPPTIPLFVPLAFLPWAAAAGLLIGLNLAATAFIGWGLLRLLGWRAAETRSLWLIALLLLMAPVHATITAGQTGLLAMAALIAALLGERAAHRGLAGLAYGVGTALKVQMILPFLAYLAWRRRWRTLGIAAVVIIGLTIISVGRMELAAVPWLDTWLANLGVVNGVGGVNDPGPANESRYALVNLQFLLSPLIADARLANVIALVVVGIAAVALVTLIRDRPPRDELLALSGVVVLGMLVTYHRYYDAVLLMLPMAWALGALGTPRHGHGVAVLALCATFILPVQTALIALERNGVVPPWLTGSSLWQVGLLATHAWALVGLMVVILAAAMRGRSNELAGAEGFEPSIS